MAESRSLMIGNLNELTLRKITDSESPKSNSKTFTSGVFYQRVVPGELHTANY